MKGETDQNNSAPAEGKWFDWIIGLINVVVIRD